MNERLQEIVSLVPFIKKMTNVDAAICVWNKDGIVEEFFGSKNIDVHFEKGMKVNDESDPLAVALRTGVPTYNKVPKEVFGAAFEGTITPIKDKGEIVGAVTYCFSTEEKDGIITDTEELAVSISQTDESIGGIMNGTKELASNMNKVQTITDMVRAQAEEAARIVGAIQDNAKYSNILALNASIESARAGQAGKGFAVVSDEMRKFSKLSSESAAKINHNLVEIEKSLDEVGNNIGLSTQIADEQATAAIQLNSLFGVVSQKAKRVNEVCKNSMQFRV